MNAPHSASDSPIFVSAMLAALERGQGAPHRADAPQWRGWLDGAQRRGEFKQEERTWLGIDDWLRDNENTFAVINASGREVEQFEDRGRALAYAKRLTAEGEKHDIRVRSITREQLKEFVRANQVQVQEVVMDDNESRLSESARVVSLRDLKKRIDAIDAEIVSIVGAERVHRISGTLKAFGPRERENAISLLSVEENRRLIELEVEQEGLEHRAGSLRHSSVPPATKYSSYQVPGGSNYRELLLTLPAAQDAAPRFGVFNTGFKWKVTDNGVPKPTSEVATREEAQRLADNWNEQEARSVAKKTQFQSAHFDQPNILAHVRFNERIVMQVMAEPLAEERRAVEAVEKSPSSFGVGQPVRVLFIEEMQSDWHQTGRKRGYQRQDASDAEVFKLLDEAGYKANYNGVNWVVTALDGSGVPNRLAGLRPEANQFAADLAQVAQMVLGRRDLQAGLSAVPDAPFKATWPMLAMKRMVRYAAEHGFDRIAWTTGAQQAARYDLSKRVDSVSIGKIHGGGWQVVGRKDSGVKIDTHVASDQALVETIGKDLAEKAIARGGGSFTGSDLVIGGEGMSAFYDAILPNEVNKFAKRFGGRVGQSHLGTAEAVQVSDDLYGWDVQFSNGYRETRFTEEAAKNRLNKIESAGFSGAVHSIDITPGMREAALQGLPLFKRGEPEVVEADDEDDNERPAFRF